MTLWRTYGYEGDDEQRRKAKITQGLVVNFKLDRDVLYPPYRKPSLLRYPGIIEHYRRLHLCCEKILAPSTNRRKSRKHGFSQG